MHPFLSAIICCCDGINRLVGRAFVWLTLAVVVMMCANVILRYLFGTSAPWQIELVLAMHAATFLAVMGFTLQTGGQVRVDVCYAKFSDRTKAWVELVGSVIFLLPVCAALLWFAWPYVASSWRIYEASSEYHGLPGIFLLKSFLLVGPALLAIQGIGCIARSLQLLTAGGTHG